MVTTVTSHQAQGVGWGEGVNIYIHIHMYIYIYMYSVTDLNSGQVLGRRSHRCSDFLNLSLFGITNLLAPGSFPF